MFKPLTCAVFAGALLPGCVLTTGDTDTDSNSGPNTSTDPGTSTDPQTSTDPATTDGTTDSPTTGGTTEDVPTSEPPMTSTSSPETTDAETETDTVGMTTGVGGYGMCGWNDVAKYYDCAEGGGVPGLEDPAGIDPIACPDGLVAGEKCTEDGPIDSIGCCMPNGDLFFCDTQESNQIEQVMCGA